MAHRAEEKERRRQERIAQEEAARKAAARRRTLQVGGGVVLGLVVIAVVAIVALAGGGGSKDKPADASKLAATAKAAGCTFSQFKSEGRNHTAGKVTYKTNPPTSGNHNPTPAQDGFYRAGNSPPKENFVHTLEHGRIEFQYKPGTPAADVAKLRKLAEEPLNGTAGYHVLMFENDTNMPSQFAATAWTKSITCPTLSTPALGAMREFRTAFTDKGPELIP
jgi:type II secretory pathway pseudopilin PulG